jgi:cytochrome c biogenesis protein CcdA
MLTMAVYAIGAAGSLLAVGYGVGKLFQRKGAASAGLRGRLALGASLAVVGGFVMVGLDHVIEAVLISAMPDWLTGFAASL